MRCPDVMIVSAIACGLFIMVFLGVPQAEAETPAGSSLAVEITSCVVAATDDKASTNCTAVAAKACDGKALCKLRIGRNLTGGRDIDPGSGFTGKMVTVHYNCGPASPFERQHGPYYQNDHAILYLGCPM